MSRRTGWALLVAVNVLGYCVLNFNQTSNVASGAGATPPFANAVEQRIEMIQLLKDINDQLKQQNELLRSGELKVTLAEPK